MKHHRGCLTLLLVWLIRPAIAAPVVEDAWSNGRGTDQARVVISQCLDRAESTPPDDSEPCIHAAYQACEREHGTSQHAMNDCAYFSKGAWEGRLAAVRKRLLSAKTIDPKFGRAEPLIHQLVESDRRWDEWNQADCEMQTEHSKGGSIHSFEQAICPSQHAAHRALKLEGLSFWWRKRFSLPE